MLKEAFFKTILFLIPLYLLSIATFAQQKYWLELDTAMINESQQTVEKIKDRLTAEFGNQIRFHYQSRWHPVISISTKDSIAQALGDSPFLKNITIQNVLQPQSFHSPTMVEYAYALEQINAFYLTDSLKLSGKGVKIGVIDGGFMGADVEPSLKHLIDNDQITFFQDYLLRGNTDPFYGKRLAQDDHGTQVLKMIAGSDNGTSIKYGMAENAQFYLARTDHGIRERRLEEDYWVAAVELFYEMGIRLVNSSLGYTDGFDKRKENHSKKEVNGKSSMISKTAQSAAEKGMLIVSAAGNDGHNKWGILSLPSDAKDVLTVGAVRFDDWSKIYYSSIGPEKLDYAKPDVACFAANGTSFSTPVITGLAACIWEYDSTLSNLEVIDIIKKGSHLWQTPNNYIGYGVPNGKKIAGLLNKNIPKSKLRSIMTKEDYIEIKIPDGIKTVVVFHKSDKRTVIDQRKFEIKEGQSTLKIENSINANFSTITSQDKLYQEIEWK